mgnify:CR=1 FL=1
MIATMEKNEMIDILTPIFRNVFADRALQVSDELNSTSVANWDSLSHMLLITEIENHFHIKFKLKDLNKMRNVGDMMEVINTKL